MRRPKNTSVLRFPARRRRFLAIIRYLSPRRAKAGCCRLPVIQKMKHLFPSRGVVRLHGDTKYIPRTTRQGQALTITGSMRQFRQASATRPYWCELNRSGTVSDTRDFYWRVAFSKSTGNARVEDLVTERYLYRRGAGANSRIN